MIRMATDGDEPGVRDCAEDAYAPYVPLIGREPAPMVADFAAQIAAGQVHVLPGDHGGIDGFIVFYPRGDHMFLENVAVRRRAAGRGIGKALIGVCEAETRRLGLDTIRLYTNVKMAENLRIYRHLGFVETDRRREDGFDRVYFEKHLR